MLYDSSRIGNATPEWFDPQWWAGRGTVTAAAEGRGSASLIQADGRQLVLRHYRRGGFIARISRDRYLWRSPEQTRSFHEWRLLYGLRRAGLPVPAPLAASYQRTGRTYVADLLLERLLGVRSLAEAVRAGPVSLATWVNIGRVLRRFHASGVYHADLNAHNVLLGAGDEVWLIDFDRGALRSPGWWCDSNLVRLLRSLEKLTAPLPPEHFTSSDWHSLLDSYIAAGPEFAERTARALP